MATNKGREEIISAMSKDDMKKELKKREFGDFERKLKQQKQDWEQQQKRVEKAGDE